MKMRSIKRTPTGSYSRGTVRTLVKAVHVLETDPAGWEVRTLGEKGGTKRFDTKTQAIEYAFEAKPHATVVVHQRQPRKVTVARARKTGKRFTVKEIDLP